MLFSVAVYTFIVYTYLQKGDRMKKAEHVGVYLKLNKADDADIIKRLNEVREKTSKQGYIKELIRTDIVLDCFRDGVSNGLVQVKKG